MPNQDLHGIENPLDLVIVSHPDFLADAQRLGNRRESEGLTVRIITPQQVFNEFSSGARDATAIKKFMKMLYDRAGADSTLMPRYLLLFGDGSYNKRVGGYDPTLRGWQGFRFSEYLKQS